MRPLSPVLLLRALHVRERRVNGLGFAALLGLLIIVLGYAIAGTPEEVERDDG